MDVLVSNTLFPPAGFEAASGEPRDPHGGTQVVETEEKEEEREKELEEEEEEKEERKVVPRRQWTPLKVLFIGRTVVITSLCNTQPPTDPYDALSVTSQADLNLDLTLQTDDSIVPLFQVSFFNPLCTGLLGGEGPSQCELSCFNMSVTYTDEPTSVCKP